MLVGRRDFLKLVVGACAAASAGEAATKPAASGDGGMVYGSFPLPLWLERNGEAYAFDAATPAGYECARHLLRDVTASRVGYPTMSLLHQLSWMNAWLALHWKHVALRAHSGLRMPSTHATIEGAAQNSLHLPDARLAFRACDLHSDGVPPAYMGDLAAYPKAGGVGVYKTHTHVDDGRVRRWRR